ncbi:uncharacterized protein LOC131879684 isoform X2 [Tigriopus californicus]|uniref:uncharacterized protein LOC131879684 isoform X2 n=1 Tax=Tigriopus californicus TaxID=6832 RepID=UPI0027D9D771|nr:uncharacterized protein LOC131879684 isoform X2 [Tigriopus californicus]|eukprot:TCALIF_08041-PA protein Name:"Protein of unknown function" AED:0.16 eAED:0.19 QI:4/1/0.5/1/0.66/0.75/4/0/250
MMSRGVNRFSYSRTGLGIVVGLTGLAIQPAMAFLPSWSDLFSSLRPFQDPTESPEDMGLDEESARLGFVQLNSGTNSFNTTLNLTGHILLGLGIASALLARMFLEALKGDSNQGGYSSGSGSGYGRRKRSLSPNGTLDEMTQLIPPLLEKLEDRLRLSGLDEDDCLTQTVCEANRPQLEFSFNTLGDAIRDIHGIILENMEQESEESLENDEIVIRHLNALTIGLEGKDCKMAYPKCSKPYQELMRILHS